MLFAGKVGSRYLCRPILISTPPAPPGQSQMQLSCIMRACENLLSWLEAVSTLLTHFVLQAKCNYLQRFPDLLMNSFPGAALHS